MEAPSIHLIILNYKPYLDHLLYLISGINSLEWKVRLEKLVTSKQIMPTLLPKPLLVLKLQVVLPLQMVIIDIGLLIQLWWRGQDKLMQISEVETVGIIYMMLYTSIKVTISTIVILNTLANTLIQLIPRVT